jgi:hypothetical protein
MRSTRWIAFPGVLSAAVLVNVCLSTIVTAVLLDTLALRFEGGGSITSMFPGFTYANAMIMKFSLFQAALLLAFGIAGRFTDPRRSTDRQGEETFRTPVWGIASLLIPGLASLAGTVVLLFAQTVAETPTTFSMNYFTEISRAGVISMIVAILASVVAAINSLFVRRERPAWVGGIGLFTGLLYLVLIRYWEFYKLGFDQDLWNNV